MPAPTVLSPALQHRWLVEHIPFRVQATIIALPMKGPWAVPRRFLKPEDVTELCTQSAIFNGRLAAMRWLIMFVGISESKGAPAEAAIRNIKEDVRIDRFDGGVLIDRKSKEASALARMWKGCSQAISHPTQDTNHPKIGREELTEAFIIVAEHLQNTIYRSKRLNLLQLTLGR